MNGFFLILIWAITAFSFVVGEPKPGLVGELGIAARVLNALFWTAVYLYIRKRRRSRLEAFLRRLEQ